MYMYVTYRVSVVSEAVDERGGGSMKKRYLRTKPPLDIHFFFYWNTDSCFTLNVYTMDVNKNSSTRLSLGHDCRLKFSFSIARYKIK